MDRRLQEAQAEMARQDEFEYIITNEDGRLDDAVTQTWQIIQQESQNPTRQTPAL